MFDDVQVRKYLERMNYQGGLSVDRRTLDDLIFHHQCAIPFETVTLRRCEGPPSLETDHLFEKVVERGLGGYCFELNKLFNVLLVSIGFSARPAFGRSECEEGVLAPINHRGIIVDLPEGSYSVEVGFGGPVPSGALLLSDGEERSIMGDTFVAQRIDETWWNVDRVKRSGRGRSDEGADPIVQRRTELSLCAAKVEDIDFEALNVACSAPGTLFRDHDLVNLRTGNGYVALFDDRFTRRENGRKEVITINDETLREKILSQVFGIAL